MKTATAAVAAEMASPSTSTDPPLLAKRPDHIARVYSTCVGDAFHYMDRPKVRTHHAFKKAYFVALRDAWFVCFPDVVQRVEAILRAKGLSSAEIQAKWHFDFDYFAARVPRSPSPPMFRAC